VKNTTSTVSSRTVNRKDLWNCEESFFGMDYKLLNPAFGMDYKLFNQHYSSQFDS